MKSNLYKNISIVIPTYNEEANVEPLVKRLHETLTRAKTVYELIFIDDHSTDNTQKVIRNLSMLYPIILSIKKGKKGKAFSIQEGIRLAQYNAVGMIDADLQYPPEVLPKMIEALNVSDIVVTNRKQYKDSIVRKVLSNTFRFVFGRVLFNLEHDIQSGLKIFTREVFDTVKFTPSSSWTFDLEFLHRAKQAGFSIQNFDVVFSRRKCGNSKVTFLKTTFEIGFNAIILRTKRIHPVQIPPLRNYSMLGAGIGYKRKKYITHTTIPHHLSALRTLTLPQKIIFILLLINVSLGIYLSPLFTFQVIVAILSFIYFVDVLFNLYLIIKSLTFPQEIVSTHEEINKLKDSKLPIYTILCPLYREASVLPQFLEAMDNLSWPKEKLEVVLLLEEDDKETIMKAEQMDLPSYSRVLIVPSSAPKTKPKACNYGLSNAKGEYLVVYDAEDIPDPLQLKKAYLGFLKVKKDVICLQAKLNYYNPHQNLLTRFFTAEYSLWFDVTLTGLQSISTTIPLGGTSNHFRTENLRQVEGWDPFNVTEDADLGVRLFKKGFKTAIIDSVTLEEANSKLGNWFRQRSRWIKGYMQTYLVHIRESSSFPKKQGVHSLIFQLVIGGKIAFILINPFLWLATFSYFALYAYVGPQIETLYPSGVFYMAIFSLVFGNFLFLYYYMIGLAKKNQWNLIKFVFLVPIYWLMISISAFIAFYQLIFKPHYWEKTVHGFHLQAKKDLVAELVIEVERESGIFFPAKIKNKLRLSLPKKHFVAAVFIFSMAIGNILNFLYNAYLGRVLALEDFALVSLVGGLYSFILIIAGSFGTTVAYKTGYLIGKKNEESAFVFWNKTRRRLLLLSLILGSLWVLATPILTDFFQEPNVLPLLLFTPIIFVSMALAVDRGFLSSKLGFGLLAIVVIVEPVIKLITSVSFVQINLSSWAYTAIPISVFAAFIFAWIFAKLGKRNPDEVEVKDGKRFPKRFLFVAFISGLSTVILLNLDVVLAKHYLSATDAGLYALVSLVGKMVFFLGSLATPFIIPLVSRNEGGEKDSKKVLNLTLIGVSLLVIPASIALGLFGNIIAPILFGPKILLVVPYLLPVSLAIACFSLARVYIDYYLAKKHYTFSLAILFCGLLQIGLITVFHQNIASIVYVTSAVWVLTLFFAFTLHKFSPRIKILENNIADFLGLFEITTKLESTGEDKLRILIFNWRDTKHKWAGGAEVYIHEIAKRWIKEGNHVTVFSGNDSTSLRNEVVDGINIVRRGGLYTVYLWGFLYYILKFRGKYDLIVDSENGLPFFTPLYAKEKKFLLIHHVHQEVFRKSLKWPFSMIALFLEARLMPFVYKNVQVITVSPSSREEILRHKLTKHEPIIIYNGVDLNIFKPGKKSRNPLILYVGRLQYYKSLDVLIRAAKNVLLKVSNAEFIIAGEGGQKDKLQKLSEKLGISSKIKFLGRVSEEEKIKLFQKAWVFVNPSFMEGWGITTIEAAACGTPAVASNVPGLRDSVKNSKTGFLVTYGEYEGFARNIATLIVNDKLRKQMSLESVKWAGEFSWDESSEQFLLIVKDALKYSKKRLNRVQLAINRMMSIFL